MDLSLVLLALATALGIAGYVVYLRDILRDTIAPNRWSWLIWSFAIGMEASTYQAVNQDWIKSAVFFIGFILCVGTTVLIWRKARWYMPHWTEWCSVAISFVALVLWLQFDSTLWAYWLMVAIVPISFIPTLRSAFSNPAHEHSRAWLYWVLCDLATLGVIATRFTDFEDLPLAIADLLVHLSLVILIRARSR